MPRKLEAMMIVADKENLYIVSGQGDVIEPDGGVCAIGTCKPNNNSIIKNSFNFFCS